MEEKYWELREAVDRTLDAFIAKGTEASRLAHVMAIDEYETFCTDVLEKIMEENSDILARLKN